MHITVSDLLRVMLFSSVAMADLHTSCTCHNGDSYNWRMTTLACTSYDEAKYQWGGAVYDTPSGRCTQRTDADRIAGDQWEEACQKIAKAGFQCVDGKGTCYADPASVRGSC
ncbi:uncharacterized protein E0L32_005931 [Thyridium curvatum]|uniref:Uncharacterized protein n=1 Tax=Thyridium curvatum TaxID=1093900 RepID=A0A507BAC7_9PEZI|nr:uncharacterized protein E0L32_005931 [Thyridium curvatum]TPX13728.1 hypothetical protein E0L32_005931 [Thyridium curvatum]